MAMAIFREDGNDDYEFAIPTPDSEPTLTATTFSSTVPLVRSKLRTPPASERLDRELLLGLLDRSRKNAAVTMLIGRAGSGKTALATDFVTRIDGHSWYSIDSSDADWNSFQSYFRAALLNDNKRRRRSTKFGESRSELSIISSPSELFADLTAALELRGKKWPTILVLDGIHHLYDCRWFAEFFSVFIASIPHYSHVVMLGRSKPSTPVWRMRSKQVLNVIDEKLLAFSLAETQQLFSRRGFKDEMARNVHAATFGRPAEIMAFLESSNAAGAP